MSKEIKWGVGLMFIGAGLSIVGAVLGKQAAIVVGGLLILTGIIVLLMPHKKKTQPSDETKTAPLPPLPFTQVIKQEANPHVTQTVNVFREAPEIPKRSAADQDRYDKAKKSLLTFGTRTKMAVAALRYLLIHQSVTEYSPGSHGGGVMGPAGMKPQDALWAYNACAGENLVTCKHGSSERTYSIPPPMVSVLEQLLHKDAAFRDMAM